MIERLRGLLVNARPVDALDVLFVAVLAYAAIVALQRARSRFVLVGLGLLVGIYFGARVLEMYLTLFIYEAVLTVAVVAVVVIFQEDVRRAFERLGSVGPLAAARAGGSTRATLPLLVDALDRLARKKVGALVVLKGLEPLERHLTGGNALYGRFSQPLLDSIFDSSSAGHDGAVVIENDIVTKFGVQLPLASRPVEDRGTRHSAALGLSERSDAFVLVVSEERGTISVAQAGKLDLVSDLDELRRRIADFRRATAPEARPSLVRRLLLENSGAKAAALGIAMAAWVLLIGKQTEVVAQTFVVPVTLKNLPPNFIIENQEPTEVRIALSGPSHALQALPAEGPAVQLDASKIQSGPQKLALTASAVDVPRGVVVQSVDPQEVGFAAHETVVVSVPIKPVQKGLPPSGFTLGRLRPTPPTASLVVRKAERRRVKQVLTEALDLSEISDSATVSLDLVIPRGTRLADGASSSVTVSVELSRIAPAAPAPKK